MSEPKKNRRRGLRAAEPHSIENPPADLRPTKTLDEFHENEQVTEEVKIKQILESEVGTGARIHLSRREAGKFEFRRIATIPIESFSVESIQSVYGGGDYKAQVISSKGHILKGFNFGIDLQIPSKHPDAAAAAKPDANSEGGAIARLRQELLVSNSGNQNQAMMTMMLAMQESADKRFAAMMAAQTAQLTQLAQGRPSGNDRLLELLLPKLFEQRGSSTKELVETIQLLDKIKGKGGDADESEKSPMDVFFSRVGEVFAPIVERIVTQKMGGGSTPLQPAIAAPRTEEPAAEPAKAATTEPPAMMDKLIIGQFRTAALKAAQEKRDPFQWADNMIGMVPETMHDRVFQTANEENWFTTIFGEDPEAQKHLQFLITVREEILLLAFKKYTMRACYTGKIAPEIWADQFAKWVTPEFDDTLFDLVEDQEEFIKLFAEVYAPNKAWLDELKKTILAHAAPQEPESPVEADEKGPAAGTS